MAIVFRLSVKAIVIFMNEEEDANGGEGTRSLFRAHVHSKEPLFLLPLTQREQNETALQGTDRIRTRLEKVDPRRAFRVLCADNNRSDSTKTKTD